MPRSIDITALETGVEIRLTSEDARSLAGLLSAGIAKKTELHDGTAEYLIANLLGMKVFADNDWDRLMGPWNELVQILSTVKDADPEPSETTPVGPCRYCGGNH
jgi:hypothetical protein